MGFQHYLQIWGPVWVPFAIVYAVTLLLLRVQIKRNGRIIAVLEEIRDRLPPLPSESGRSPHA